VYVTYTCQIVGDRIERHVPASTTHDQAQTFEVREMTQNDAFLASGYERNALDRRIATAMLSVVEAREDSQDVVSRPGSTDFGPPRRGFAKPVAANGFDV
jgi:hypothetical protein